MSDTVTLIIGHHVGKVEAVHRLKEGFVRTNGHLGPMIAIEQETWEGDTLRFRWVKASLDAAAKTGGVAPRKVDARLDVVQRNLRHPFPFPRAPSPDRAGGRTRRQ